jgi:hypothetical protein
LKPPGVDFFSEWTILISVITKSRLALAEGSSVGSPEIKAFRTGNSFRCSWHAGCVTAGVVSERTKLNKSKRMRKSIDLITEAVRSAKHPFRHVNDLPHKEQKNRYERRKIKEFLRTADWLES